MADLRVEICHDIYISCHDIYVRTSSLTTIDSGSDTLLRTLAEFRYELRRFLHFSESRCDGCRAATTAAPVLLQVAGAPDGATATIAYAAERLGLKHNSAVELVDRSAREGLLTRKADPDDRRRALLQVTSRGRNVLRRLSGDHARELNELGPRLEQTMKQIRRHAPRDGEGLAL